MKRLLGIERVLDRVHRYWMHYGDDGRKKLTVETKQDATPVLAHVKRQNELGPGKELRYKATVTFTDMDRIAKENGAKWGISTREAFAEIMAGETVRSQHALRELTDGRDYRKLQAEKRNSRYVRMA